MVDVEDVDGSSVLLDPVDDPVGAAPGSVPACEGAEHRFADAVRIDREGGLARPAPGDMTASVSPRISRVISSPGLRRGAEVMDRLFA
jgi:hypothetical protein